MHKEIPGLRTYSPKTGRVDIDWFPSASTQLENSSMDFEDSNETMEEYCNVQAYFRGYLYYGDTVVAILLKNLECIQFECSHFLILLLPHTSPPPPNPFSPIHET